MSIGTSAGLDERAAADDGADQDAAPDVTDDGTGDATDDAMDRGTAEATDDPAGPAGDEPCDVASTADDVARAAAAMTSLLR
jgi:hypothetical protein